MSYYDDPWGGEYDPSLDPNVNMSMGDPQTAALIEMMLAQGQYADPSINAPAYDMGQMQSLVGLVPDYQMSGKPLTVANQTAAMNAWRSNLFDPAMAGFGGADAFAADAFAPTQTVQMEQSPELQTVYGYLRKPRSVEGIIAMELMAGGTPSTAVRNLRELFTLEPQVISENLNIPLDEVDQFKADLLVELPAESLGPGAGYADVKDDGTGVDWEGAVRGLAADVYEDWSAMPLLGPTGPQFDPATGMQISSGGERRWEFDESGAPIMVKVTTKESPLAEKYHSLGLPSPMDEYTTEDFWDPAQQERAAQYAGVVLPAEQEALQQWLTAQAENKPSMQETMTPYNEGYAPGNPAPDLSGPRYNLNPGVAPEELAMVEQVRQNALAPQGNGPPSPSILDPQVIGPLADQLIAEGHDLPPHWTYSINPDGSLGEPLPPEYQAGGTAGGGPAGQSIGVAELMRRRAAGYGEVPPRPRPPGEGGALDPYLDNYTPQVPGPGDYPAGDPATYEQFLAQQPQTQAPPPGIGAASGGPFAINMAPAPYVEGGPIPPVTINGQPNPAYQDYLDTLLRGQFGQDQAGAPPGSETAPWTTPQPPPPGIGAASGSPFAIDMARSPLAGPPQGGLPQSEQSITAPYRGGVAPPQSEQAITRRGQTPTSPPRSERAITATPQITNAMIAAMLGGNTPTASQGGLPQSEQPGRGTQTRGQTPSSAPQSEQSIQRQAMMRYSFPEMATGERSTRGLQAEEDARNASVLGGTTDRTGRRHRATRTGEQARAYRAAHDQYIEAFEGAEAARQRDTAGWGKAASTAFYARQAGVRPLDQVLMARRLTLMGAGMPSSGYLPGT